MAENEAPLELAFEVLSPLQVTVRAGRGYWRVIASVKHPVMADRLDDVVAALQNPDEIRQSNSDPAVFLSYKALLPSKWTRHGIPDEPDQRRGAHMAEVKVYYDRKGNTLTVWFGDPKDEAIAEETGEEIVLMKDESGRVIGFEKLNFVAEHPNQFQVAIETTNP